MTMFCTLSQPLYDSTVQLRLNRKKWLAAPLKVCELKTLIS